MYTVGFESWRDGAALTMREGQESTSARGLLEQAETLWGTLADATLLVWWAKDLKTGRVLYVSPGFEALWEMPCDDLYQRPPSWLDRIHPDDRPRVTAKFGAIPLTGQAEEVYRLVLPSGKRRWIRDRGILMHRNNEPSHVAGLAEDITEARTAQIRLAVQHMVIKILAEGGAPEDAFPRLIEAMADPLEWATASLWLVDPDANVLRCASSWRQSAGDPRLVEEPSPRATLAHGESLAGRAWASRQPVFESAVPTDPHYRRIVAGVPGVKSAAAFPIQAGDQLLGVLDFTGTDAGIPEAELVRTVTALARQIGLWLERHRADEEARQETRKLKIVNRALTVYLETASWQRAADEVLTGALELTGSPMGFFGVVVGGTTLRVLTWSGLVWDEVVNRAFYDAVLARSDKAGYLDFPVGTNLFSQVITDRVTVLANDPAKHPGAGGTPPGHPALTSWLGVPIHSKSEVVGVLGMANRPGGYTAKLREELEALGALAAVLCQHYRAQTSA